MKTTKEIEVGKRYTCVVQGQQRVARVIEVDTSGYARHSTVRIVVQLEEGGERRVFRSPGRLLARLGERIPTFGRKS